MDDVQRAEIYGGQRAAILAMMAVVLVAGASLAIHTGAASDATVAFGIPGFAWRLSITIMAALLIATGGGLLKPSRVMALANDETTRDYRRRSMVAGFWTMLAIAIVLYAASFGPTPPSARLATRLVMDLGEAAALFVFATLEWRASR